MSRKRCVFRCESKSSLFSLPKTDEIRNQWLLFIYNAVPDEYNPNVCLCTEHFTEDSFLNLGEYSAGYTQRLLLKPGAVPTLFPTLFGASRVSESQPSTSQQGQGSKQCSTLSRSRHVACQTDGVETRSVGTLPPVSPKMRSVGTQLSMGTLKGTHVRSKGTQATVSCLDVGTETALVSSTPINTRAFRPRKRPRLEEEKDGDGRF